METIKVHGRVQVNVHSDDKAQSTTLSLIKANS